MAEPERIKVGPLELRFFFDGAATANALTMFEMTVPPGARVPGSHFHVEVDEAVYGLEGVLTYTVESGSAQLITAPATTRPWCGRSSPARPSA